MRAFIVFYSVFALADAFGQSNVVSNGAPVLLAVPEREAPVSPLALASQDYEKGDFASALSQYRLAAASAPSDYDILWRLAYCCFATSNYVDAETAYEQYVRVNPNAGLAHFWLGCTTEKLGQSTRAEKEFQKCIELDANYASAYDWLGWCLNARGRYKEAASVLEKAIELDGESEDRLTRYATALIYSGGYNKATNVCSRLLERYPDHAESYQLMGDVLYRLQNFASAKAYYQRGLKLKPDDYSGQFSLGNVYFTMGQFSEAAEAYKKACLLAPQDAEPHIWRGWSLFQARRYDDALTEMERAHEVEPRDIPTQLMRFGMFFATDHYRAAFAAYPVASGITVGAIFALSFGGFVLLTVLSFRAGACGPGALVSGAWTVVFFAEIYASMLIAGLIPGVQPTGAIVFGLLGAHIPFLLTSLLFFSLRPWGGPYRVNLNFPLRIWVRVVIAYALAALFVYAYEVAVRPPTARNTAFLVSVIRPYPVSVFLSVVILSPLAEEVLCRGLIYASLRRRIGLWAIPVTGAVFAGYHFDPSHFLSLFALGLVLTWAREVSGTIWLPFVIHAGNNALAYCLIRAIAPA